MSQKAETNFKVIVKRWLKAQPNTWHFKVNQVALRGIPDIIGCVNGRFVAIELKKDAKAKIDMLQSYTLQQIANAGGFAGVAYPENWAEIQAALVAWTRGKKRKGALCGIKWNNQQP